MKPLWEGALSFGLILIPVKLYKATEERKPGFHLVSQDDHCPVKYMRVCKYTGMEIPYNKISKSYEYTKGRHVIFNDEDLKKVFRKRTDTINIVEFTDVNQVDTKYYEQPYYIEPAKGAAKVYALLREALKRTGMAGIAKYVLHNLEHLGVLKVENNILVLNQIRYHSEIRGTEDLKIPSDENLSEKEIDTAIMLIKQLADQFRPEEFRDTYSDEIKKAIKEKARSNKIIQIEEDLSSEPGQVIDLLETLKKSLEKVKEEKSVS